MNRARNCKAARKVQPVRNTPGERPAGTAETHSPDGQYSTDQRPAGNGQEAQVQQAAEMTARPRRTASDNDRQETIRNDRGGALIHGETLTDLDGCTQETEHNREMTRTGGNAFTESRYSKTASGRKCIVDRCRKLSEEPDRRSSDRQTGKR